jgi:hypothetical protein
MTLQFYDEPEAIDDGDDIDLLCCGYNFYPA